MRIAMLTREWPPDIYGGAGVHVDNLVAQLRHRVQVDVHCFGQPRSDATAHPVPESLRDANPALQTLGVDLEMAASIGGADVVHSHTWYANMGGQFAKLLYDVPHVLTAHSLEPLRPWKAEQLGGGYRISSWAERTAYLSADAVIAVSEGMRTDVLATYPEVDPARVHVVHNGIDCSVYRPDPSTDGLAELGVDPTRPYALFVGRITRQKGITHLLRAARHFDPDLALVLCASSPDTHEIGEETAAAVAELQSVRGPTSVVWIQHQASRQQLIQLFTHARLFTCPSVYEPLGIVNLEAMACQTPVVASAVGGIPEVVREGETGLLVPYTSTDPELFEQEFAACVNFLARDASRAREMGVAGRARAERDFSWDAIAQQTIDIYQSVS